MKARCSLVAVQAQVGAKPKSGTAHVKPALGTANCSKRNWKWLP